MEIENGAPASPAMTALAVEWLGAAGGEKSASRLACFRTAAPSLWPLRV